MAENPGGRTYYLSIPVRPLSGDIAEEHLERVQLYYCIYGLVIAIVGAIAILLPILFGISVISLLSWLLVLGGTLTLLQFILICGAPGTTSFVLVGALHLVAGLFIILQPQATIQMLIWIFAGWFLLHGLLKVLLAYQLGKVTTWPAVLVSGLLSICLAVVIVIITPSRSLLLIAIYFGVDLGTTGLAILLIAFMAYLGKSSRAVSDVDVRNEPLLSGRGPPAAAVST